MIDAKEYHRQYRLKNRERLIAYKKAWVLENAEKVKIDGKNRYQNKKEEIKQYVAKYKKLNPAIANANKAKRKSAKKLRTPMWLTDIDYERIANEYKLASILTKLTSEPWHVDHVIPLQGKIVSGFHVPANLKAIRGSENCSKQNQF
jgi:ribonuclease HII